MAQIPIIDVFAGPGGLGEGFSRFSDRGSKPFKIHLSIEKEAHAHKTLELRAFYRSFPKKPPHDYFSMMKGDTTLQDLYNAWPEHYAAAQKEAWQATLGETSNSEIDRRIAMALAGAEEWVLVGGPPCQAYSVVGRVRNKGIRDGDSRVRLYEEYLRIVARFKPSVFVMENVRGLLSAKHNGSIFERILADLKDPSAATGIRDCPGYRIHSFATAEKEKDSEGNPVHAPLDYLIKSEDYAIPQNRHRVILLGIRKDLDVWPTIMRKNRKTVTSHDVIKGLPRIRSALSKEEDSFEAWSAAIHDINDDMNGFNTKTSASVRAEICKALKSLKKLADGLGGEFVQTEPKRKIANKGWYLDHRIGGVANHAARGHLAADLRRYFFAACYGKALKNSPKLMDFPRSLLPKHVNVGLDGVGADFSDRFRVQLEDRPATTVTSHISKDGHYFIHYDPTQCRSLTVREAARIQTFPDNYFFCGGRTNQYQQVGNAVPPLLAKRLASVVWKIMEAVE